jgi:hypothetical protein
MTKQKVKPTEVCEDTPKDVLIDKKLKFHELYKRNEWGLIDCVDYVFDEDGSVNWRGMIKDKFLYPNRGWFDLRSKQVPQSIDGLDDNQLLIMLGGIKELAKLRGFHSVVYDVKHVNENYVIAKCKISWIGNYESANNYDYHTVVYEDVANATLANTDDFCAKFLETIACNRAFVRCVRNFLGIHIVGADEIDKSKSFKQMKIQTDESDPATSNFSTPTTPSGILEKLLREKNNISSFDEFKSFLRPMWKKASDEADTDLVNLLNGLKDCTNFSDISAKDCRKFISIFNSLSSTVS